MVTNTEVYACVSFENGKWRYIDEGGLLNLYRHGQFQRLASKAEITMFHKLIELEQDRHIEYDCDNKRIENRNV